MAKIIKKLLIIILLMVSVLDASAEIIKGVVKDAVGVPLPGVSVIIEGTSNATSTASDGSYSIDVKEPSTSTLIYSLLGMEPYSVKIGNKRVINVELNESTNFLNESVVVGYQEVKRKDLLGSVTSVQNKKLMELPVNTVGQALTGRLAGVSVVTTEGEPDPEIKIKVRGTGSITQSSAPLILIDGFPASSLNDVPASQIQSIDVLKDAFSTAIYGSRGANGVVIVTTKNATGADKVSVNLNAYYGQKFMANKNAYTPMNSGEYVKSQYESAMIRGKGNTGSQYQSFFGSFLDMPIFENLPTNDYVDMIFGNPASNYNVDLSVSGKSKAADWTMNVARIGEDGIMTGSSFNRTNVSFKANLKTGKTTSIDFNIRYSDVNSYGGAANNIGDLKFTNMNGRVNQALVYAPIPHTSNVYGQDDEESYAEYWTHPLRSIADNDLQSNRTNLNVNGAFNWWLFKYLKFQSSYGYGVSQTTTDTFIGSSTYWSNIYSNFKGAPANRHYEYENRTFRFANTLNFNSESILNPQRHKITAVIGQEFTYGQAKNLTVVTENYPMFFTSKEAWKFMASGVPYSNERYIAQPDVLSSFFGRINYSLLERYSLGVTLRADGSSRFGPGNKWGVFPSFAVSWDIAKEPFMLGASMFLDQLKLRYSFGAAGNNNVPSGQIYSLYQASATNNIFNENSVWIPNTDMPNPNLTWETTKTNNLGLDFSFLKSRIGGTFEIYDNFTDDLLVHFPVSGTGYNYQYQNRAKLNNKGMELSLNFNIVQKKNFDLTVSGNIAYNKNVVLDLGGLESIKANTGWASSHIAYDYMVTSGQPLGNVYGYQVEGIYQVDDFTYSSGVWQIRDGVVDSKSVLGSDFFRPGSVKIKDQNGDNVIDEKDIVNIGNTIPDFVGGFSINTMFFGFDLTANFSYMIGNDVYNANKLTFTNSRNWAFLNMSDDVNSSRRWTSIDWETGKLFTDADAYAEANKNATIWSPYMERALALDYGIEDGSFLRLQSLTLGYTLPAKIVQRLHMSKIRLYVTGTNLFCFTKYSGYDPEVDSRRNSNLTPGCDFSAYPKAIGYVFGVNIGF